MLAIVFFATFVMVFFAGVAFGASVARGAERKRCRAIVGPCLDELQRTLNKFG
jgi:ABC-type proline/glycine betaine transport system permease subunit